MNIYLISSESRVLMDEKIMDIIGESKNKIIYNAEETAVIDILNEASYVAMFDEMKYLIVKNANFFGSKKLKEEEEQALINYLKNPYPFTTLIFTTYEEVDGRKKITKRMKELDHFIHITLPKGFELQEKVNNLLIKKKYKIEKESISYIINSCLGNYDLIVNEIEKLDLYYEKPSKIDFKTVKEIVSKTMSENQFKFVEAVIAKDLKKAKRLYEEFNILKMDPFSLIHLLAREYRFLIEMKNMEKKRYSKLEIEKTLKIQDWQFEKLKKEASNYHEDDLKDCLIRLEKLDYEIKSGKLDKQLSIDLFLLDLYDF